MVIYWSDPDSHTGYLLIAVHTYRCTHKLTDMQSHNIHILTQCIHTERKNLQGHWCVNVLPKEPSSTRITGVITHVDMFHPYPPLSLYFLSFTRFWHSWENEWIVCKVEMALFHNMRTCISNSRHWSPKWQPLSWIGGYFSQHTSQKV